MQVGHPTRRRSQLPVVPDSQAARPTAVFQRPNVDVRFGPRICAVLIVPLVLLSCDRGSTEQSSPVTLGVDIDVLLENTGADQAQRTLLADGSISRAELEQALSNVVTCVDDLGFDGSWEFVSESEFSFSTLNRTGTSGDSAVAHDGCSAKYSDIVEMVWSTQHARTPTEEAEFNKRIVKCLNERGIKVNSLEAAFESGEVDAVVSCKAVADGAP